MTIYQIVPATMAHVEALEGHLRQADMAELQAAAGISPGQALREGLACSLEAWAGLVDGQVICIFGLAAASLLGGAAIPWMLGSDEVNHHAAGFLRRSRWVVSWWHETWDLENWVDARHTQAIRWLRWLGFTINPAQPRGVEGRPFHRFSMRRA